MAAHTPNPSSREAGAEESTAGLQTAWSGQQVTGQAELYSQDGLKKANTETKKGGALSPEFLLLFTSCLVSTLKRNCSILGRIKRQPETESWHQKEI